MPYAKSRSAEVDQRATPKPTIFIVSSSEAADELDALTVLLGKDRWALIEPWHLSGEFSGTSTLQALFEIANKVDFAIILYTGPDVTYSKGSSNAAPRDNVLFELGFFLAHLGADHVLVISPEAAPKLPSNYAGYGTLTYDPTSGTPQQYLVPAAREARLRFVDVWRKPAAESKRNDAGEASADRVETVDIVFKKSTAGLVPIYRDLASSLDWFSEFENNMRLRHRSLNSKLIYYGPGLAKYWFQMSREGAATREMTATLRSNLARLLKPLAFPNINIIDLGVGDFEKGHIILDYLLQDGSVQTINYFPLDVSYEMLVLALNTRAEHFAASTLRGVQQNGSITALNATFSQLRSYRHLFSPPSRNVFLLLGNTLGNETVETQTLTEIGAGMNTGDLLIVDVQLIEESPPTIEEDNAAIQKNKEFYTGPLRVCGYSLQEIDLSIRRNDDSDRVRGLDAVTYEFYCSLNADRTVRNPGFRDGTLFIAAGEVCVCTIRLYHEGSLNHLCEQSGFSVVEKLSTVGDSPKSRRFEYVVAQKR